MANLASTLREILSDDPWVDIADPVQTLSLPSSPVASPFHSRSSTPELIEIDTVETQDSEPVPDDKLAPFDIHELFSPRNRYDSHSASQVFLDAMCVPTSADREIEAASAGCQNVTDPVDLVIDKTYSRNERLDRSTEDMEEDPVSYYLTQCKDCNKIDIIDMRFAQCQGCSGRDVEPKPATTLKELTKLKAMKPEDVELPQIMEAALVDFGGKTADPVWIQMMTKIHQHHKARLLRGNRNKKRNARFGKEAFEDITTLLREPEYKTMLYEIFLEDDQALVAYQEEFEEEKARFKQRQYSIEMQAYHYEDCFNLWEKHFQETAEIRDSERREIVQLQWELRDEQEQLHEREKACQVAFETLAAAKQELQEIHRTSKLIRMGHQDLTFEKGTENCCNESKETKQLKDDVLSKLKDLKSQEEQVEQTRAKLSQDFERVKRLERDVLKHGDHVREREMALETNREAIAAEVERLAAWEATVMTVNAESKANLSKAERMERALNRRIKALTESSLAVERAARVVAESEEDLVNREENVQEERRRVRRHQMMNKRAGRAQEHLHHALCHREKAIAEQERNMGNPFPTQQTNMGELADEETRAQCEGRERKTVELIDAMKAADVDEYEGPSTSSLNSESHETEKTRSETSISPLDSVDLDSISTRSYVCHYILALFTAGPVLYFNKAGTLKLLVSLTSSLSSYRHDLLLDRAADALHNEEDDELSFWMFQLIGFGWAIAHSLYAGQVTTGALSGPVVSIAQILNRYIRKVVELRPQNAAEWEKLNSSFSTSRALGGALLDSLDRTRPSLETVIRTCQCILPIGIFIQYLHHGLFSFHTMLSLTATTTISAYHYHLKAREGTLSPWEKTIIHGISATFSTIKSTMKSTIRTTKNRLTSFLEAEDAGFLTYQFTVLLVALFNYSRCGLWAVGTISSVVVLVGVMLVHYADVVAPVVKQAYVVVARELAKPRPGFGEYMYWDSDDEEE